MRGKYSGLMSIEDFFQSFYQDANFFRAHGISHIKSACLYFTPCDERGEPLVVRNVQGDVVDGYMSAGPYQSAAQLYEDAQLEPRPISRSTVTRRPRNEF